ncbi:hypothetical protein GYMLUDRAFT_951561 [Collybiopsis luxurians FD-317 M1]|nr:hypothetical protein GYMLUDRAFT_951561 [Collybiopsis luxurians FD-317 M1]
MSLNVLLGAVICCIDVVSMIVCFNNMSAFCSTSDPRSAQTFPIPKGPISVIGETASVSCSNRELFRFFLRSENRRKFRLG